MSEAFVSFGGAEPAVETRQTEPLFHIDLAAIGANFRSLRARYRGRDLSAVVKSDAYGLGLERVARCLAAAGCRTFWVNDLDEAVRLRVAVPDAKVYVLFGLGLHSPANFAGTGAIPVLASLQEVELCSEFAARSGRQLRVAVQLDTGLGRLGLTETDVERLVEQPDLLVPLTVDCWVSHLAAFNVPDDPMNEVQRRRLIDWTGRLPAAPVSLSSSSGLFMGDDWHFDIARAGSALFGVQTSVRWQDGLKPCYRLTAPILRVAELPAGNRIGYHGMTALERDSAIATIALGYGNGLPQGFADVARAYLGEASAPFVGGMSMNLSMLDVTDLPVGTARRGTVVEVLNAEQGVDAVAGKLGFAPNVLLTQIGASCRRRYTGDPVADTA
jgi:alanine racemase